MIFNVNNERRVATLQESAETIVCDNSGYSITFTFDEEWAEYPNRTARFKWNNKHQDVEFTGNTVEIPPITNTRTFTVGVYCGESAEGEPQISTTDVKLPCLLSVRCGDSKPNGEGGENYTNEARGYAQEAKGYAQEAKGYAEEAKLVASQSRLCEFERDVTMNGVYNQPTSWKIAFDRVHNGKVLDFSRVMLTGMIGYNPNGIYDPYYVNYIHHDITRPLQQLEVGQRRGIPLSGVFRPYVDNPNMEFYSFSLDMARTGENEFRINCRNLIIGDRHNALADPTEPVFFEGMVARTICADYIEQI